MTADRTKAARELLAFYVEAGVDGWVQDEPVNHFAPEAEAPARPTAASSPERPAAAPRPAPADRQMPSRTKAASAPTSTPTAGQPLALDPDTAVMAAREAARSAATLDDLRAIMQGFQGCALRVTARNSRPANRTMSPVSPLPGVTRAPTGN